jgi:hypothetical protein
MKKITDLLKVICFCLSAILLSPACKDDPSTEDLLIGNWCAAQMFFGADDAVALSLIKDINLEFDEDGDFRFTAEGLNPVYDYNGIGNWEVDGNFLEITFNSGSDTFCGDGDHRFTIDFDGEDDLTIEDVCSNGNVVLKIYLDKK